MATREQWQRVQETFDGLRTCTPAEREDRLRQIAEDDPQLAADVRGLLQDHDSLDPDFLTPPPPPDLDLERLSQPSEAEPDPLLGQQVDAFCVVELIARGGMGSVYRVEQENPRRTVALKLLHREYVTRPVRSRFEYESAILARLQHPNIAQIHHAGTHGDQPYFAMEYVENARWITAYAREEQLTQRQRLLLFCDLCEAVQYGHQRGIIHRDLKPANVLVDGEGRLKVIDFGIARITDTDMTRVTQQTDAGQVLGTLQYMSPEQCAADPHGVDVRSDVYSLGVILYELLCERLPYHVKPVSLPSAIRVVCETLPTRPSIVRTSVRGDLEHVLLTALEKNPEARYQSVADLRRDVRHYLAGEPIEARKPTAWLKAVRWIGNHPVVATVVACLAVAVASLLLTFLAVRFLFVVPTAIEVTQDQHAVQLFSRGGGVLKEWRRRDAEAVVAKFVNRADEFGGDRVVLVGFRGQEDPENSNFVAIFELGKYDRPAWNVSLKGAPALPDPHGRGYVWTDFGPRLVEVANVFPGGEHPGDELIVLFQHHEFSQSILRIYDFGRRILFERWLDTTANACVWLEESELLVLSGSSGFRYDEVGGDSPRKPRLIFGIKPIASDPEPIFLKLIGNGRGKQAEWSRYLSEPADAHTRAYEHVVISSRSHPRSQVKLRFMVKGQYPANGELTWLLNGDGTLASPTPTPNDMYQFNLKQHQIGDPARWPVPSTLKFRNSYELPPPP